MCYLVWFTICTPCGLVVLCWIVADICLMQFLCLEKKNNVLCLQEYNVNLVRSTVHEESLIASLQPIPIWGGLFLLRNAANTEPIDYEKIYYNWGIRCENYIAMCATLVVQHHDRRNLKECKKYPSHMIFLRIDKLQIVSSIISQVIFTTIDRRDIEFKLGG